MAVANDGTGTPSLSSGASPQTLSTFTVGTGANRVLFAILAFSSGSSTGVSVTWNTTENLSLIVASPDFGTTQRIEIWRLINPTSGNHSLVAAWTGATQAALIAVEMSGVDQTTPVVVGDNVSTTASSVNPSVGVPSATGDATIVGTSNSADYYPAQTQTLIANVNTGAIALDATYALGGTSNTHAFTLSAVTWGAVGIHVKAAAGGAAGLHERRMGRFLSRGIWRP